MPSRRRRLLALACLLGLAGCSKPPAPSAPAEAPPTAPSEPPTGEPEPEGELTTPVSVYFPDQKLDKLEAEAAEVTAAPSDPEALLQGALEALLAGPTESAHQRVIPAGTALNSVKLDGQTAVVDLTGNFVSGFQGGSGVAALTVYSVVNTAAAVPGVAKVLLTFDGQPGGEFGGVLDLSGPLTADPSLVGSKRLNP